MTLVGDLLRRHRLHLGSAREGGAPRFVVRFEDPARPSYRNAWALGRTRIYFPIEDRQSDIWVIEVKRP